MDYLRVFLGLLVVGFLFVAMIAVYAQSPFPDALTWRASIISTGSYSLVNRLEGEVSSFEERVRLEGRSLVESEYEYRGVGGLYNYFDGRYFSQVNGYTVGNLYLSNVPLGACIYYHFLLFNSTVNMSWNMSTGAVSELSSYAYLSGAGTTSLEAALNIYQATARYQEKHLLKGRIQASFKASFKAYYPVPTPSPP